MSGFPGLNTDEHALKVYTGYIYGEALEPSVCRDEDAFLEEGGSLGL